MTAAPVPDEILVALVLLPGYLLIRVGLYFARYAGNWAEYEKVALSLFGSVALTVGWVLAFPGFLPFRLDPESGGITVYAFVFEWYVAVLVGAVLAGAVLGYGLFVLFGQLGLPNTPQAFLLRRLGPPIVVRVVTEEREIVGSVRHTDEDGTPAIIGRPRLVTSCDGTTYREKMGSYVYIDPDRIKSIYFESPAERAGTRGGGLVHRIGRRVGLLPDGSEGRTDSGPWGSPGPPVSVSSAPVEQEADRVRARGTVRNELPGEIQFAQVRIGFEDTEGTLVGTGVDSFERLGEGDAWWFDVTYETDDPDAVESFSVEWYVSPSI